MIGNANDRGKKALIYSGKIIILIKMEILIDIDLKLISIQSLEFLHTCLVFPLCEKQLNKNNEEQLQIIINYYTIFFDRFILARQYSFMRKTNLVSAKRFHKGDNNRF